MAAEAFRFLLDGRVCFAQGHTSATVPRVGLMMSFGDLFKSHEFTARLTPAEARTMAAALEAAATFAENVLDTGLGESAVDADSTHPHRAPCHKTIPDTQNLCTRLFGHSGECRCSAADVDARKGVWA